MSVKNDQPTQSTIPSIGHRFILDGSTTWWTVYAIKRGTVWAYSEHSPGDVCDFTNDEVQYVKSA